MTGYKASTDVMRDSVGVLKSGEEQLHTIIKGVKTIEVDLGTYYGKLANMSLRYSRSSLGNGKPSQKKFPILVER